MNKKRVPESASTRLRTAIEETNKGDVIDIVKSHDVDLYDIGNNGDTFLHSALKNPSTQRSHCKKIIEILTILLDLGMNIDVKNNREQTVLHLAIIHRMKDIIDFLIERNADINVIDACGNSISHCLIENEFYKFRRIPSVEWRFTSSVDKLLKLERRSVKFIESLVKKGFDFDRKNNEGLSPTYLAIKYNLQHILPILLQHTNDVAFLDENHRTLLHAYLHVNSWLGHYTDAKRPMLTHDFDESRYSLSIINMLFEKGVSIGIADKNGETDLEYIFRKRDMKIVKLLVDYAIERHDKYLTKFLHIVIKDNHLSKIRYDYEQKKEYETILSEILESLISKTTEFHNEPISGYTTVQLAALEKRLDVLRLLDNRKTEFDVVTSDGNNLLHLLSQERDSETRTISNLEYEEMVDILVSRSCDINALNAIKRSPMHEACANGITPLIRKFIVCGADVNLRTGILKWTPLHLVADNDQSIDGAQLLIAKGAKVNLRDTCGRIPLHLTLDNNGRLTKILLSSGAQADVQDKTKCTPLVTAVLRKHLKEVEELLKYGANFDDSISIQRHHSLLDDDPLERRPILDLILQRHWIKLTVANLPCPIQYKYRVQKMNNFQMFYDTCRAEIERLKQYSINDRTSLLRFLQMDPNRRCFYINNKKLQDLVDSPPYEEFPNYTNLILAGYHESKARKPLLEPAKVGWLTLTNIILPDICVYRILAYLNNATLLNLIEEETIEN